MDTLVIQQFFRELTMMSLTVVGAYCLVGGLIFVEMRIKRAIIQLALK